MRDVYLAHLLTVAAPSSEPRVRNTEEEESAVLRPRGGRERLTKSRWEERE